MTGHSRNVGSPSSRLDLSDKPQYPSLMLMDFDKGMFFVTVANQEELCLIQKVEIEHFDIMKIVDCSGVIWQPKVMSYERLPRIWWRLFDWIDPLLRVSLKFQIKGEMRLEDLKSIIRQGIKESPDIYKASLDWHDALTAVERAETVGDVIKTIQLWRPRVVPL